MDNNSRDDVPWVDGGLFNDNFNKFPMEELAKYSGQHVAWNLEGTRILASGVDDDEVDRKLVAMGIRPSHVVHGYVDSLDDPCHL
jgi:hypothetical protein